MGGKDQYTGATRFNEQKEREGVSERKGQARAKQKVKKCDVKLGCGREAHAKGKAEQLINILKHVPKQQTEVSVLGLRELFCLFNEGTVNDTDSTHDSCN